MPSNSFYQIPGLDKLLVGAGQGFSCSVFYSFLIIVAEEWTLRNGKEQDRENALSFFNNAPGKLAGGIIGCTIIGAFLNLFSVDPHEINTAPSIQPNEKMGLKKYSL